MKEIIALELNLGLGDTIRTYDQFVQAQAQVQRQIIDIRTANRDLNKELRDQVKIAEDLRRRQATGDAQAGKELDALLVRRRQLSEQLVQNQKRLKDLSAEQRRLNQSYAEVDKAKDAYQRLSAELRNVRARVKAVKAEGGIVDENDLKRVEELDRELKEIDASVGQFQRNIGNYQGIFQGIGNALKGDFGGAIGSIDIEGFGGQVGKLVGQFPKLAGAVGLVATGLFELGRFIANVTLEYEKLRNTVTTLTGETGANLQELTVRGQALATTFQVPFEEVVRTANVLNKELAADGGVTETLDNLATAALALGPAFGESLDEIQEYATQIRAAGGDQEDLLEILILSTREGIFSDKGIDLVKEAGLSLREETKTTRDALLGAFGEEFTERIFNGINDGSLTTLDAIKEVASELQTTEATAAQVQTVIADVFKGAGEDAGERFIALLAEMDGDLEGLIQTTDEYTQRQIALLDANEDLSAVQNDLGSQFAGFGTQIATIGTRIKTVLIGALSATIRQIRVLGSNIAAFFDNLFGGDSEYITTLDLIIEDQKLATQEAAIAEAQAAQNAQNERTRRQRATQDKEAERAAIKAANEARERAIQQRKAEEGVISALRAEISALNKEISETSDLELQLKLTGDIQDLELQLQQREAALERAVDRQKGILQEVEPIESLAGLGTTEDLMTDINRILELTDLANEARLSKEKDLQEDLSEARETADEDLIKRRAEQFEIELAREQERQEAFRQITQDTGVALGETFGDFFSGQIETFKDFQREALLIALNALERVVEMSIIEAQIRSLASNPGPLGFLRAALIIGVIRGLFAGARAVINRFEDGGVLKGPSHAQGGVQIFGKDGAYYGEAEGDEAIINRKASTNPKALGVLSKINEAFGGRRLGGQPMPQSLAQELMRYVNATRGRPISYTIPTRPVYQTGGVLQRGRAAFEGININEIDYDRLGEAVANSISRVTIVTDVNQFGIEQRNFNTLIQNAREI